MRLSSLIPILSFSLSLSLAACVDVADDADLAQTDQDLHGPSVVPSGPMSTGLVRFHDCLNCRGSNTLIRQDLVITNKHVVDWTGTSNIFVQFGDAPLPSGPKYQVINKWHSPTADLAVLQLACSIRPGRLSPVPLSTSTEDFAAATSVTLAGYGPTSWTGTDFGIKRSGVIPLPSSAFSWSSTWSTSGLIGSAPGDSGGSLYFDLAGVRTLAGVITWGTTTDSAHYTAGQRIDANLTWLRPLLETTPMPRLCPLEPVPEPDPPKDL